MINSPSSPHPQLRSLALHHYPYPFLLRCSVGGLTMCVDGMLPHFLSYFDFTSEYKSVPATATVEPAIASGVIGVRNTMHAATMITTRLMVLPTACCR